jgi:hypothetical protein
MQIEKKLESELISIAHRILKLKGKSELHQLHIEAQRLYEILSVLKFVEAAKSQNPPIDTQEVTDYLQASTTSFDTTIPETENQTASPIVEIVEPEAIETVSKTTLKQAGLWIDPADKLVYIKQLFANSPEDYNRVLNQILTFDNLKEVENFIQEMVKPDYDNWAGKDQYAIHFMQAITQKFA